LFKKEVIMEKQKTILSRLSLAECRQIRKAQLDIETKTGEKVSYRNLLLAGVAAKLKENNITEVKP
jgi:hypothetical protein